MRYIFSREDAEKGRRIFWNKMRTNPKVFEEYRKKMILKTKGIKKKSPKYRLVAYRNWQNPIYKRKQREIHLGDKNPAKKPENKLKISKAMVKNLAERRYPKTYTNLEKRIEQILKSLSIDYIHQYPLGYFTYDFLIPSFKKIINANGCYWHGCKKCYSKFNEIQKKAHKLDSTRRAYAKNCGWDFLEIWEHQKNDEIKRILARL